MLAFYKNKCYSEYDDIAGIESGCEPTLSFNLPLLIRKVSAMIGKIKWKRW